MVIRTSARARCTALFLCVSSWAIVIPPAPVTAPIEMQIPTSLAVVGGWLMMWRTVHPKSAIWTGTQSSMIRS